MMTYINFPRRIASFQEALRREGVDVLVGTRLKTITHLSGGFVPWRSCLVAPAEGELQLITPVLDAARLGDESWLVNAVGVMDRLTLVKEPEEIKLMRQATALCDAAHEEVRDNLRVGISEKEIAGIAEAVMRDRESHPGATSRATPSSRDTSRWRPWSATAPAWPASAWSAPC